MDAAKAESYFMEEAERRGISTFDIPRYKDVFRCRVIAPHKNGNAWITVKYWPKTNNYEAQEFYRDFVDDPNYSGYIIICNWGIWGNTPGELLDKLQKHRAYYPFSTVGTYLE